ncbi:hypothetical protein [Lactiplantibacillus daowaiensis]|uniref:Extracellular protein n=1 Tax=Lactiplantibacillus daowaiensis TaxID=2559918 RepID=A0ABW1RY09_9LACO|nr:hypothetical protein [Lactiplantibacillus daowaiensis]
MKFTKSLGVIAMGIALLGGALPAQAALHTRTVPASFRHTWYHYDSRHSYSKLQVTKHGTKGTIYKNGKVNQVWANAQGKRFVAIIHSHKKISVYNTRYGSLKPYSDSIVLTKQTKHGRASLKVSVAGFPNTYYRSKSAAYQYR